MDGSSTSTALVCPACGKSIDPLRAGQVAILDGVFRYFCKAECKSTFVDLNSKRSILEALTAEPPRVASVHRAGEPAVPPRVANIRGMADGAAFPHSDSEESRAGSERFVGSSSDASSAIEEPRSVADLGRGNGPQADSGRPTDEHVNRVQATAKVNEAVQEGHRTSDPPAPASVVSPTLPEPRHVQRESSRRVEPSRAQTSVQSLERYAGLLPVLGIAFGALSVVLGYGSEPANGLRLAFGLVASSAAIAHVLLRAHESSDLRRWFLVGPVLLAASAALLSFMAHDVHAGAHAAYLGLCSAGVALACGMVARARRDVERTRGDGNAVRVEVGAPLVRIFRSNIERGSLIAAVLVGWAAYANGGGAPDVIVGLSAGAYAVYGFVAVAAIALAHARGQAAAAQKRIFYKDAEAFDAAARADVAVICVGGTILLGEPEIVAIEAIAAREAASGSALDAARVLSLAASVASSESENFGPVILRAAAERGAPLESVRATNSHPGLGATALTPQGERVVVGSRAFLLQEKVSVAIADPRISELEGQGRSVVLIALGERLVGLVALQDGLRPYARAMMQKFHESQIEPVLLSGEARDTCETIARALDVEHVRPGILPGDRGAEVRALADGGHIVATIGHPASDDGALGAADVAVAIGVGGAGQLEWGVTLASDDIRDAALALTIPRGYRERAKAAGVAAIGVHVVALLGVGFGVAPAWIVPIVAVLVTALVLTLVRPIEGVR